MTNLDELLKKAEFAKQQKAKLKASLLAEITEDQSEIESATKSAFKAEANKLADVLDSEFYICLCFDSRAAKEQFLSQTKIAKTDDRFVDGHEIAKRLGVELPPRRKQHRLKTHSRWLKHVR